jgi:hypothetical protein
MAEPVYLSAFRRTRTCNVALLTSDQTLLAAATVAAAYEEAQIVRVSVAPCAHPSASEIDSCTTNESGDIASPSRSSLRREPHPKRVARGGLMPAIRTPGSWLRTCLNESRSAGNA